mmetsp:Transcript_32358/g.100109  ORF Transcript_32358/g.100109 Transcript_32358/m.100109 type:complete len:206 (+) Transcript_32358:807-1424(+)
MVPARQQPRRFRRMRLHTNGTRCCRLLRRRRCLPSMTPSSCLWEESGTKPPELSWRGCSPERWHVAVLPSPFTTAKCGCLRTLPAAARTMRAARLSGWIVVTRTSCSPSTIASCAMLMVRTLRQRPTPCSDSFRRTRIRCAAALVTPLSSRCAVALPRLHVCLSSSRTAEVRQVGTTDKGTRQSSGTFRPNPIGTMNAPRRCRRG